MIVDDRSIGTAALINRSVDRWRPVTSSLRHSGRPSRRRCFFWTDRVSLLRNDRASRIDMER